MTDQREANLMLRALTGRWPIDDAKRQAIIERLFHFATSKRSNARTAINASRAIIAADGLNMEQEQREADREAYAPRENDYGIIDADPEVGRLYCELAAKLAGLRAVQPNGSARAHESTGDDSAASSET